MRYDSAKAVMLTYVLCRITGMLPGKFVHSFGELECDIHLPLSEKVRSSCG